MPSHVRWISTLDNKTRADKNTTRKVQLSELAEALNEIIPTFSTNKQNTLPKLALYRRLLEQNYFQRSQLSQTSFYRMVRDNTEHMIQAFRSALFKRGKPARLYFDNGSNYTAKEILQACVRLDIHLSHAPVRDGAAKGKIERFFRGFRDRFLVQHLTFQSLDDLNHKTRDWIEHEYNAKPHSGIQMVPLNRFNLDHGRIQFLTDDEYTEEVFFIEETRKVSKTNVFAINSQKYECPVDLREKKVQVRYDRTRRNRFVVYFDDKRMGDATLLDLHFNANQRKPRGENA